MVSAEGMGTRGRASGGKREESEGRGRWKREAEKREGVGREKKGEIGSRTKESEIERKNRPTRRNKNVGS